MEFVMTVFSHDAYVMSLPPKTYEPFYNHFPDYITKLNYHNKPTTHAPVIRLFGTTPTGQKACVHVHGYFPFIYIKVEHMKKSFESEDFLPTFLGLIESLYQQAYHYKHPVIFRGVLQHKYDFYGYHGQKELFLKIYVLDQHVIPKIKELFSSKAINGQPLQSYQGHINTFMHFFSDLNIYGLHELMFSNVKFRKNIAVQQVFQKANSLETHNLSLAKGIDIIKLSSQRPELFSMLEKISTCYLELDIHYENIVNYLYSMITRCQSNSEKRGTVTEADLSGVRKHDERIFKVQITRALNQFWFDEKQRRQKEGISLDTSIKIDCSRNIEGRQEVMRGQMDPFWMNFVDRQDTRGLIKKYVKSYSEGKRRTDMPGLSVDKRVIQNYQAYLARKTEEMVVGVKNRWKYYSDRSKSIISGLLQGEAKEIPDWDELSQYSDQQKQQEDNQKIQPTLFGKLLHQQQSQNANNTVLFRQNYTVAKGVLKKDGYFSVCEFCKSMKSKCRCSQFRDLASLPSRITRHFVKYQGQKTTLKYNLLPPTNEFVLKESLQEHQFPFYSFIQDLFEHYKIPKMFPRTKRVAQLLDLEVKPSSKFTNAIGLVNSQKLPSFWRPSTKPLNDYLRLKYLKTPPTLEQILVKIQQPKIQKQSQSTHTQSVFTCDIVQLNFELICQCTTHYANPETDRIVGVVFSLTNEINTNMRTYGTILLSDKQVNLLKIDSDIDDVFVVENQKALLMLFALIVFKTDPDLLISYDHQKKGIYYLIVRAYAHKMDYCNLLGRALTDLDQIFDVVVFNDFKMIKSTYLTQSFLVGRGIQPSSSKAESNRLDKAIEAIERRRKKAPVLRKNYNFYINVAGRVCINLYRIVQFQRKLPCYTMEFVTKELFGHQLPQFSDKNIYNQFCNNLPFALQYFRIRVKYITDISDKLNAIGALIQKSKLYGCNFAAMLQRGSQFKIEAIISRVSMHSDYLLLSGTKNQVSEQKVLDCRPLVLQPPKQLFVDPVLVFDFQSLYPSIMIAFNLCYCTCLGNIKQLFDKETRLKRFGVTKHSDLDLSILQDIFNNFQEKQALEKLKTYIFVTPNKVAFLKKNIKEGLIPRMLLEFLMSRIMIKNSTKLYRSQRVKRILHERQAAMKLFMNVTFGYTGASFTGRMPCGQLADSVVELAKFCLTTCITQMNASPNYGGGRVIYGDTDSVFFLLKNKSMEEAFSIGKTIARDMTAKFPYPIDLKLEKAYESLIMVSKKRYFGKKYEYFGAEPKFQGKGIQAVRRDSVDLVGKSMNQLLANLLDYKDLSLTKRMFKQIISQTKSGLKLPNQFIFAKQVKALKYGLQPPAHGVAARKLESVDVMLAPKYGERMKYLVVKEGLSTLKDRAVPVYLYNNQDIDYDYYINKHLIPSLQRCFTSIVNLEDWAISSANIYNPLARHYFSKKHCVVCANPNVTLCLGCVDLVGTKIQLLQHQKEQLTDICKMCVGCETVDVTKCIEWGCPNLWPRKKAEKACQMLIPELKMVAKAVQAFDS